MFFIIQGQIIMFHKKTKTYIIDLNHGKIFGEISFHTGKPRSLTARSRGFSDLMYLDQLEFM
jgi:CRP-like cAMP-binding protein